MRVLVLGGAVGAEVMTQLRAQGAVAIGAGRNPQRADRVVDLGDRDGLAEALADVDVVVNAAGVEDASLAAVATANGVAFVDVTATQAYVEALEALRPQRAVLVSVGLAPGLTNLLAAAVHAAAAGPIDLAVVLGAGERHGRAATDWSYRQIGRSFADPTTGRPVRNYSAPRTFDLPGYGRRRLYRADFSDQHTLSRDLGVSVRTYFGLDSRLATTALAALTWLPDGSRAPRGIHLPGSARWLALARAGDGAARWARGTGQSRATAVVAAVAATAAATLPAGVHHLHQVLTLADLPRRGIELDVDAG
jgi:saccharopine dehydrogenase-like NADP-dependent oxidoreductase